MVKLRLYSKRVTQLLYQKIPKLPSPVLLLARCVWLGLKTMFTNWYHLKKIMSVLQRRFPKKMRGNMNVLVKPTTLK